MKRNVAYFGILQFLYVPGRNEAINIGVLFFDNDGKVQFKGDLNLKRAKLIYPGNNLSHISMIMEGIQKTANLITDQVDQGLKDILNSGSPRDVAKLLDMYVQKNILLREASSLLFTEISPTVINQSPEHTLESIHYLYMGQHEKQLLELTS
ncbi:MAG: hypothetical protein ACOVMN_00465 [Flexibacteraceae bacterium]